VLFFARQPIFDKNNNVIAYELLYRNGYENSYTGTNDDEATISVIINSFYSLDLKTISDNKVVFINFTENLIKQKITTILPSEYVVIEILETVEPTKEVLFVCKKIKDNGFTLALDDFIFDKKFTELIELSDIIKVDFKKTKGYDRKKIFETLKINKRIKFLAEKIETIDEFKEAIQLGYTYFQGYYFSKPIIISTKAIPSNKHNTLEILELISKKEIDFNKLEELILKDIGLSYKIMKLINSSSYYLKSKVNSIRHGITFLGEKEIVKWLYVILLNDLNESNSQEIINLSLLRAKFSENICNLTKDNDKTFFSYITGLFSVMDAILNCSMEVITRELYLPDEVKAALNGETNILKVILELVINYEKGEWGNVVICSEKLEIKTSQIAEAYFNSLKWLEKHKLQ
jgi:EAL and modified HD-GYP domain-containing signal transduction protein